MNELNKIRDFKRIQWDDIPDYGLYSNQLMHYLDEKLIRFFPGVLSITPNMVNNYVKNEIILKPINRKYYRTHISCLIVIIILKKTFPIKKIKETLDYQLSIMRKEDSYNNFMDILEVSFNKILDAFDSCGGDLNDCDEIIYEGFSVDCASITWTLAIHAFIFQTITRLLLENSNSRNIKAKNSRDKIEKEI